MGDMEGKEVSAWKGPLPANLEADADFAARADRWWAEHVLQDVSEATEDGSPARILVVSHGGLLHVLLQGLMKKRRLVVGKGVGLGRFRFPNASVSVVEVEAASSRTKLGREISQVPRVTLN